MSDKSIIYFSRDGSTAIAARLLAEKYSADMVELVDSKKSGMLGGGYRAMRKKGTVLVGDPWKESESAGVWILGTPIWASNGSPAMNEFVRNADFSDKKVYLFTVQAAPDLRGSSVAISYLKGIVEAGGGEVLGSLGIVGASPGKTADEEALKESLKGWDIP